MTATIIPFRHTLTTVAIEGVFEDSSFTEAIALRELAEALSDEGVQFAVLRFVEDREYRANVIADAANHGLVATIRTEAFRP